MKKVLSVLLAAAMVMGMSVASFAAHSWTTGAAGSVTDPASEVLDFEDLVVVERDQIDGYTKDYKTYTEAQAADLALEPGDNLYFPLRNIEGGAYTGEIDTDWSINIEGNKYVANASYYSVPAVAKAALLPWGQANNAAYEGEKYVKVEIVDDLDEVVDKTVEFVMYIADGDHKGLCTEKVIFEANLSNVDKTIKKVDFDHTNDVDVASTWAVAKNAKGTATFDFDDNVFFTVKMVSEEKVTLNLSVAYDKAIDKLFDYDADLSFYNFKGTKDAFTKTGELFIPADEDTFIYEVVDGKLVEVEATWTDEYTITDVTKEYEGWVIETKELGYYVVSDVEAEIEAEVEEPVEAPVEADKANPETGAADFVGAAVAMAVVSVAAAGALALKK